MNVNFKEEYKKIEMLVFRLNQNENMNVSFRVEYNKMEMLVFSLNKNDNVSFQTE